MLKDVKISWPTEKSLSEQIAQALANSGSTAGGASACTAAIQPHGHSGAAATQSLSHGDRKQAGPSTLGTESGIGGATKDEAGTAALEEEGGWKIYGAHVERSEAYRVRRSLPVNRVKLNRDVSTFNRVKRVYLHEDRRLGAGEIASWISVGCT